MSLKTTFFFQCGVPECDSQHESVSEHVHIDLFATSFWNHRRPDGWSCVDGVLVCPNHKITVEGMENKT